MPTLEILWSAYWPTLLIFAVIAALVFGYFFTSLAYGIRTDPERTSADDSGRAALRAAVPAWPAKHFISACCYCHHVTRTDAVTIRVGDELRVSHGICPACMAKRHPEVARMTAFA